MKFSRRSIFDTAIKILNFFAGVVLLIFALAALIAFFQITIKKHWLLAVPYVAFLILGVGLGIRQYQKGKINRWQGISSLLSILLMTILIFSFLSFVLNRFGLADYTGFDEKFDTIYVLGQFFGFYSWELFECIPAVRVNNALGLISPLQREGPVAGFLVLAFRVTIIFIVLDVFRRWWTTQNKKELPRKYQNRRALRYYRQDGRRA